MAHDIVILYLLITSEWITSMKAIVLFQVLVRESSQGKLECV